VPAPRDRTPVLLLHGFWHGSWCWTEVLARLTGAGARALAVDMAGHGLRARRPADGWGSIPRTYVVCTGDATIPPALQRKFIADADAAFPGNRTAVRELEASHSPFLSMPDQVAGIVLDVLS
jgi:hypothetical protein